MVRPQTTPLAAIPRRATFVWHSPRPTGHYAGPIAGKTLRMAEAASFTSASLNVGSIITPACRPRMSIVRGQHWP